MKPEDLDRAAVTKSVRAVCNAIALLMPCSFPDCGCKQRPRTVRAAICAYLDAIGTVEAPVLNATTGKSNG